MKRILRILVPLTGLVVFAGSILLLVDGIKGIIDCVKNGIESSSSLAWSIVKIFPGFGIVSFIGLLIIWCGLFLFLDD